MVGIALAAVLLSPVSSGAQPEATETQGRIHLARGPLNTDPRQWSDWQPAKAEDFTWTPPRAFRQGFIKTSRTGQKAGIFVAILTPLSDLALDEFDQTAVDGFAADSARLIERNELAISGYPAHNLLFSSRNGNGLYFTGDSTPTTASVVHVKLEKEKTSEAWPFLIFFMAAPSSKFETAEAEFEQYVQATSVVPVFNSLSGQVLSRATGLGVGGVQVKLTSNRTKVVMTRVTDSTGAYRFDGLVPAGYSVVTSGVKGYAGAAQPKVIQIDPGEDTTGVVLMLDPSPSVGESHSDGCRIGFGYRRRLDGVWGIAAGARFGGLVPDAGFGCDFVRDGRYSNRRFFASLSLSYFMLRAGKAHLGLGLAGTGCWADDSPTRYSVQIPMTVEYFPVSRLSVQAGCGPYMAFQGGATEFLVGPQTLTGSLGFTWYVR